MSQEAEPVNGRTTRRYDPAEIRAQVRRGKEALSRWFFRRSQCSQSHPIRHPESLYPPAASLKDYLLEAAKTEKLAPNNLSSSIDLGEFGREAERLVNLSLADAKHPEYGSLGAIDRSGRIFLLREPVCGQQTSVTVPITANKRRVLTIHTHGDADTPFSSGDLEFLLIDPRDARAAAAKILATPSLKMLIIRTRRTPYFSDWEAFDAAMDMDFQPAMFDEHGLYDSHYHLAGGEQGERIRDSRGEPLPLTEHLKKGLCQLSHKRMFALITTAQRFHLTIYSCPLEQNVAYLDT